MLLSYYLRKYKIALIALLALIIVTFIISSKWYDKLVVADELPTVITNESLLENNLSFSMLGRDYNAVVKQIESCIPDYLDYDIKMTKAFVKYDVNIRLFPRIDVIQNIYHTNYSEYLNIKDYLISNNICEEGDFDVNNLLIKR